MNKQQWKTVRDGHEARILDPSLAALPAHPTPDEFDSWATRCTIARVYTRWSDRAGIYGHQFHVVIVDCLGEMHYAYSSAGCGYAKDALCFMDGISIPHPTRGPIPLPSPCPAYFDTWVRDLGFITVGNCGVR